MSSAPPLVIVGGGLAGSLAALQMSRARPDVALLLIEQGPCLGGNHIWSFFDSDIDEQGRSLVDGLRPAHWPDHEIRFPKRQRRLGIGYNSIHSRTLDEVVRNELPDERVRLGCAVAETRPDEVLLANGERIAAQGVIDARGPDRLPGVDLAWQKFVGRTYRFPAPHGVVRPMIMDGTVNQSDGYRFIYKLPFSSTELLIEDTYYSTSPQLDGDAIGGKIDEIAARVGAGAVLMEEETGVLPVVLGGSAERLWQDAAVPRLGLRGGFFHPTTGYSLPDATRNAALLAEQGNFSSAALTRLFRDRAATLWQDRSFFQILNRMLFYGADPSDRYRVLEHFYRLPEPVIARFYAARLTLLDKARIVSGRPPVAIRRAISAVRRTAA